MVWKCLKKFKLEARRLSMGNGIGQKIGNGASNVEVNQHPVAEVMPVLLKSGQSALRDEAVEEMKDCRSTVMPEFGPSIFYDD
ncbi:hypothetical protein DY000_02042095 [Brassica cretica]|uniref:Uncharacterized protein n=1 Tax=Brassica cretica TaxID=69181 RepID=A0ABQ7BH45_BRACR|nr:hypothetical protein DY000_02042095 [Brassica cretica]